MEDWREAEFAKIDVAMDEMRDADPLDAEREAEFKAELAAFDQEHPGVCKKCGGWGALSYYEKVDEYGGYMASEPCDECAENGKCPYCGAEWPTADDAMEGECPACGWSYDKAGSPAYPIRPEYDPGY